MLMAILAGLQQLLWRLVLRRRSSQGITTKLALAHRHQLLWRGPHQITAIGQPPRKRQLPRWRWRKPLSSNWGSKGASSCSATHRQHQFAQLVITHRCRA